jgi:Holliday junction resolvase RusA-like endonuclease
MVNNVRAYDAAPARDFKSWVKSCALDAKIPRAEARVPLHLKVVVQLLKPPSATKKRRYPVTRPDTDNYLKGILDGLNGIAWCDDSQIVSIHVTKIYHDTPGVVVEISEMP